MKVKLFFYVVCFSVACFAASSQNTPDSLQMKLSLAASPAEKTDANYKIARYYFSQEKFRLSEIYILQALEASEYDSLNPEYAQMLLSMSAVLNMQEAFGNAFHYAMRAVVIAQAIDDPKLMASALNNAAIALKEDGRLARAKTIAQRSLTAHRAINDSLGISLNYNTLGTIYKGLGMNDSAIVFYNNALQLKEKYGNLTDQLNTLGNLANSYVATGAYDEATEIYGRLVREAATNQQFVMLAKTYLNMADLYQKLGNNALALQYSDSAARVASLHYFPALLQDAYRKKSKLVAGQGDFETAWNYHARYEHLNDSLLKADNRKLLDESEHIYSIRQNELDVARLELENANFRMLLHFIIMMILGLIAVLVYLRSVKLRKAKEAIKASEKKFKMMAEEARDVIWTSDLDLKLTYISPSTEMLFGYPRDERMKMPLKEIFDDESVKKINAAIRESIAGYHREASAIQPVKLELKGRHKEGHQIWIEVVADFSMDENGEITGLQGIARNITDRKTAQIEMMRLLDDLRQHDEELKVQNEELIDANRQTEKAVEQYFDLFENSPAGFVILDTNGQVEEINNTAAKLIGREKKLIYRQNMLTFFEQEHKSEFARLLVRTLNQLTPNQREFKLGNTSVKILFVPDTTSGKLKCRLALIDITKEVNAREKLSFALLSLQTVFDAMPGGIAVIGPDYRIVNINNRLMQLHGLSDRSAVIGQTCYDMLNCGNGPCAACPLDEVREAGTTVMKIMDGSNSPFKEGFYQLYASPIFDTHGTFNGIVEVVMDVSELKNAEHALAASEKNFEELFNDLPDAVFITEVGDNSGAVINVNPAAEKQTGYSRDELLRMNILHDISMLKADEQITAEREINLLNREKIELTEQKRRKDGSLIWTEVVVQRIEIDGRYCALSVSRDITERKAIEEKLKNSRNRIMSILDAIPDMIFVLDQRGVFLEYHAKAGSKLFLPPEVFLHQSVHQIMPAHLAELTMEKITNTLQSGVNQIYNYDLDIAGEKSYFESRMVKSTDNTVLTIVRDITETVKAGEEILKNEEKYKAIFLNAPVGVFNFDQQGVILDCNELFVKIIGSSREALIGFNMLQRIKDQEIKGAIERSIHDGSGFYEGFYTSVTAEKTTPVKAWFKSIYDEKGNFVDGIGLIEDITDQKNYEQQLVAARKLAEQSDRLKSSFMATMSHELRTPLNTVIGFADMIDESIPMDQVVEFAGVISKSGKHLLDIIEDILDISLIDSGEVQLNLEKNVLGDVAESLLLLAQHEKSLERKSHLSVVLSIPAYMRNLTIYVDTNKINKAFTQIIRNAFKFTKEGAVEIGIMKKPESDTSDDILFYVKDSGIGISKEDQHYIFDVFRQVDDSSTREFEGTGLGLAISKKLVELMKGKIWVISDLGKGSEFYVKLPCLSPASNNEPIAIDES